MKVLCNLGENNHCPFPEYKVIKNIVSLKKIKEVLSFLKIQSANFPEGRVF
jgi:hypothetical protein